jgi:enoyl-CoA hydratase/carnithine racemase
MPPKDPQHSFLAEHRRLIDATFQSSYRVKDIIKALAELHNSFSQDALEIMEKMSPTSLKVTLEGLKRGGNMASIGDDLQTEYRMSQAFMRVGSDFYRGIRSTLVDKDGNPQWSPTTLEEVTDDMVEEYFATLGGHEWHIRVVRRVRE